MHEFSRPLSLFGSAPHLIALDVLHPPNTIFSALPAFYEGLQDLEVMKYPAVGYPAVSNHECVLEFRTQRVIQLGTAKGYGNRRTRHQREMQLTRPVIHSLRLIPAP